MSVGLPSIVVKDLTFRYAGRKRPALASLSFEVEPAETLLVLGPSGSGKSTLALCLNGLIPHAVAGEQQGQVVVAGRDTRETLVAELARTVGLVFQDPDSQFCMLRVDDEVAFGLENLLVPPEEMPGRIAGALRAVGLPGLERTRIDRLSGGARQRLALASILAMEPSILVFDEPTSNLDPAGADEVFACLAKLKAEGNRTIVIVEHRLEHLVRLVDRVLVLGSKGEALAYGEPARVFHENALLLEELGVWIPQASELANRLARRGYILHPYPLTVEQGARAILNVLPPSAESDRTNGHHRKTTDDWPLPLAHLPLASEPATDSAQSAIEIDRLTYVYAGGRVALRDVSLTVPEGSFFAIAGPNGAGKSTLAGHLIGSPRPPRGAVRLLGRDVRQLDPTTLTHLVGYVFQNPEHQFVAGTVYDELAFGLRVRQLPEAEVAKRVESIIAEFRLEGLAQANPFTLSHGEKRRLSVAAMLILGQRILILDEPTFGQDRRNTDALMAKLVELNRAGRTIVMITHDVRLIAEYAREVAVLVDGSLVSQGTPATLFGDNALLKRARLVAPPLIELGRLLAPGEPDLPSVATEDALVELLVQRLAGPVAAGFRPSRGA